MLVEAQLVSRAADQRITNAVDIGQRRRKRYSPTSNRRDLTTAKDTWQQRAGKKKTYNTWDSLVVTDPTTSQAIGSLSMGERTGSRVFYHLWSYVLILLDCRLYITQANHGERPER
ncbi:hypothetical protein NEUTE1DRAFT_38482 [Neurospora tetrasperma FGSC 2508]|uniref:Uncharacterized protein n=1 Tax=Neurospora tetrasperma (strain FGSC 2508 / ATCC MYA-4615 / P0657) TaxID=510951 RepID=F8MGS8_NEUT8|nr:uncharacterized protein NEUTE1DRAFT_38482 [Neurospora tetrasperma FGSC 2508]EGO59497.1 hypothetical protein NEUTE1DRAFT_38482 [Neurospora tetrasperma FGSC 2508]